jgi:hypothetical protein
MRLVSAEALKIYRRRGTMIWCALLTAGAVVITEAILVALHAANAGRHGPAGGAENFKNLIFVLSGLGNVAAILIGSTAGTQDASSGVIRDLFVTGRPRRALFRARLPGALVVFLPLLTIGFIVALVCAFVFAGGQPKPTWPDIGHLAAYTFAITAVNVALAIGLAAFASSRVVVGVLIAWNAIVAHLLIAIGSLGGVRRFIDVAAAEHLLPRAVNDTPIAMSTATAVLVLAVWVAVIQQAGMWWVNRRDV